MTSQSIIIPVASTSTEHVFKNVEGKSTDKDAEKQMINNPKKKKAIGLVAGWLRMVEQRKVPYFPQKRDKIVYLRQAHVCYLKEVTDHNIFEVTESDKLWLEMEVDVFEYLTITNISFKKYPTRIAILEVRKINSDEQETGPSFKLKYHDLSDVVDFLVLKHIFNEALQVKWNVGDKFRCLVGDKWFFGKIKSKEPFEKKYPTSHFKCFKIEWDDETELDQLSPWELEIVNKKRLPKNHGEYMEPLNIEIKRMMRYDCRPDDWPQNKGGIAIIKNISSTVDLLMKLPISNCFIEIQNDPVYDAVVSYPVDLSTIKERLTHSFYRRIDSLLMDISYLKDNAKEHKSEKIYKEAKLITQVCEDIINKGECDSTSSFSKLEEFLKNCNSSESDDDDNEYNPRKSYNRKGHQSNYKNDWKKECKQLLNILWNSEDMLPFRQPVCPEEYPDYYIMINSPICLEEINARYRSNQYESPKNMFDDIKLLITNSRTYNNDKGTAMYQLTNRVSNLFEELKKKINYKKDSPRKKLKITSNQKENELHPCRGKRKNRKDTINQNKSIHNISADDKMTNTKNNNYKKDLSETLTATNSDRIPTTDILSSTVLMGNEGKRDENRSKKKDNDLITKKLVHSMEKENSKTKGSLNSNENVRIEIDKGLNSQRRDSTDSIIVIDIEDDDEDGQQVSKSFEKVDDLIESQVDRSKNYEKDVSSSEKKLNFKKSLASIRVKRMQFKYNRIFQPRPCKSCITCQNIKQIYLDHVKSHHS